MGLNLKPGHFKILAYVVRRGRATNAQIIRVIGNPNLAIKYRQDLLRWGLIDQAKKEIGGRLMDVFYPTACSWDLLYIYETLKLFEQAVLKGGEPVLLTATCDIRVFEKGAPHVEGLLLELGFLRDFIEREKLDEDDKLLYMMLALNNVEVRRSALLLRKALLETRSRIVLLSFSKDERCRILEYDEKLSEFLTLCFHLLYTRHPKYSDKTRRFLDLIDDMGKSLMQKLNDSETRKRYAFLIKRHGLSPRSLGECILEDLVNEGVKLVKEGVISDRASLLDCIRAYFKECEKLVQKEEKSRLHELYQYLTEEEEKLSAYCEFLSRLARLPREIYIMPIGFRDYIREFISAMEYPSDAKNPD